MSDELKDKFTFSIDGKEYSIDKKQYASKKKIIHGPSIGIGAGVTTVILLLVLFTFDDLTYDQKLITVEDIAESTNIPQKVFLDNGSPVLGNPNAPITLIEFGDYQCHFCNVHFHNTEHKLLEKYVATGKLKIIFKDFIVVPGSDSILAAHGAHCANEQDAYWEYHNTLYNNWDGEGNGWAGKENLLKFADEINLDIKLFSECMNSNRYNDLIQQSHNDGIKLDVRGTPAFFIINQKNNDVLGYRGAQPYEVFEKVFDSIIKN